MLLICKLFDSGKVGIDNTCRITKLRENCGKQFEAHWQCLEKNNQEFFACRKPEREFNTCVFEKLVRCKIELTRELSKLKSVFE